MYNNTEMTSINKAHWLTENNNMRFSMPISKIDKEKRIVSGFATLDNVDKQGDIVPTEASVKAFERFRGNIREMHQPIAVGKLVSFKSDKYYNEEEEKFYSGVYVSAYISKGADDTWEKVLDGTLSGFSIGGSINDAEDVYDDSAEKSIRVIKDYELHELSLVDNPANQFANILSIQKHSDGTTTMDGIITKMELENVYWCSTDDLVSTSPSADASCPVCEKHMQNIGFVESTDTEKATMIKKFLSKFKKSSVVNSGDDANIDASTSKNTVIDDAESIAENLAKEGLEVADENIVTAEDAPVDVAVEKSDEAVEETVEKSEDVATEETVEVEKSEDAAEPNAESDADLAKAIDDLKASVADTASSNAAQIAELVSVLKSLAEGVATVNSKVESLEDGLNKFDSRVSAVEADTAVRKSGDLGGVVQYQETTEKSVWGGRFLKSADLYR
jgi:hypothetical protein